jgi:hypothetical protein
VHSPRRFLIRILTIGAVVWASPGDLSAQVLRGGQLGDPPSISAAAVPSETPVDEGGSAELTVRVVVPEGHHGYLEEGDDGYYLPFELTFPTLDSQVVKVREVSLPAGERDEEAGATVLRGTGSFLYELRFSSLDALPSGLVEASLRYQICDETTRLCYPPRTVPVPMHFQR